MIRLHVRSKRDENGNSRDATIRVGGDDLYLYVCPDDYRKICAAWGVPMNQEDADIARAEGLIGPDEVL